MVLAVLAALTPGIKLLLVFAVVFVLTVIVLLTTFPCVETFSLSGLTDSIKGAVNKAQAKVTNATRAVKTKVANTVTKIKTSGAGQKIKDTAGKGVQAVKAKVTGKAAPPKEQPSPPAAPSPPPAPVAAPPAAAPMAPPPTTFVDRTWEGTEWVCPPNTVDLGAVDNAKACISSASMSKPSQGCPPATVPDDNNMCAVGWTTRIQDDSGTWVCPAATADTRVTWTTAPGNAGYRQCRVTQPYTRRVAQKGTWVCPPGTVDTGRVWGTVKGENQCKWGGVKTAGPTPAPTPVPTPVLTPVPAPVPVPTPVPVPMPAAA